jgi:hypothetical protein
MVAVCSFIQLHPPCAAARIVLVLVIVVSVSVH